MGRGSELPSLSYRFLLHGVSGLVVEGAVFFYPSDSS